MAGIPCDDLPTLVQNGYRHLAWAKSKIVAPPKMDLDAHGEERDILYVKCKDWTDGKRVKPDLTGEDVIEIQET